MALTIETALKKSPDVPGESYFNRYCVLKDRVLEHEYAMTMAGFPGGNDHGPGHIKRVLANLDKLLGKTPLRHLCHYELFLAMMGVLYHDVGILRGRKDHAATSAQLLTQDMANYIFDENDKVFLSAIVLSHSSNVDIAKCPSDQHVKGYDIRPRLLAALVRFADELDEDVRRADPLLYTKLILPENSDFYWRFNRRIRGVKIDRSRREIVFNVAFAKSDIGLTENAVDGSFVELCFKKIFKVNRERVYCNRYLLSELAMQQIRIVLQPVEGTRLAGTTHLTLADDTEFETIRPQIPQILLGSVSKAKRPQRRSSSSRPSRENVKPTSDSEAVINGYKLFFFRTGKQLSITGLSRKSGIDDRFINNLEQVKVRVSAPQCFKSAPRAVLSALEHALGCVGKLEYGQDDDLLATYLMYYKVNYKARYGSNTAAQLNFAPDTKAVVFDFGGTLTKSRSLHSTWERMWLAAGYTIEDAGQLLKLFTSKAISHQAWCDRTCASLREKRFSRRHMGELIAAIEPVDGLRSTLLSLHDQGISLYVVSGSIREIIVEILGEAFMLLTEVKANDISYSRDGVISEIRGHPFDFEGKATFIRRVVEELQCSPLEVLFVGNSLNDTWASQSGARTLCVNPSNVDFTNTRIWNDYIPEMRDLAEILRFAKRCPVAASSSNNN